MKTRWLLLVAAGIVGTFALTAAANDWPQWRGPQRNGISKETGLLKEWPKDGPKLLWHVQDVGAGYSTPAAVGDRLYVLSNKGEDDEIGVSVPHYFVSVGRTGAYFKKRKLKLRHGADQSIVVIVQ